MQTKLLTFGLWITSASLLFGQQTSRHSGSSMPLLPATLIVAQDQAPPSRAEEKHDKKNEKKIDKQEKKDAKKQRKEDEKRQKEEAKRHKNDDDKARKEEAKREKKDVEKQQKEQAKQRDKELKKQNDEMAKAQEQQRKADEKAQTQEAEARDKNRDKIEASRQNEEAKEADRDRNRAQVADRDHNADRDHDYDRDARSHTAVASPPPPPPVPPASDHDRVADRDHDIDRDKDRDADRDRTQVATRDHNDDRVQKPTPDHDRDQVAQRDYDHDYDRNRTQVADPDRYRNEHDRDYDRDRELADTRSYQHVETRPVERVPVYRAAAPGALRAQRDVSRSIYSQLPNSNVMVLVNNANQLVLRGSAPSPSWRHRLLQLATSAAGGYSIVDQLASDAVSSVAGSATNAAISGVSGLIHRSGSDNSGADYSSDSSYGSAPPPSYSNSPAPAYSNSGSQYGSTSASAGLTAGSNGCVNVNENNQVALSGQAASIQDADHLRQLAHDLGGANAIVSDRLQTPAGTTSAGHSDATNSNGSTNAIGSASESTANPNAPFLGVVRPGSMVCVNANNDNQIVLTGNVSSPAELLNVERSLQPIIGSARLVDQLSAGATGAASPSASSGGIGGVATAAAAPVTTPPATGQSATGMTSSPNSTIGSPTAPNARGSATGVLSVQGDVEQALHSIPRLSNVDVAAVGNTLQLSGSVATQDDRQLAHNVAQQYATGLTVTDSLTVANTAQVQPQQVQPQQVQPH